MSARTINSTTTYVMLPVIPLPEETEEFQAMMRKEIKEQTCHRSHLQELNPETFLQLNPNLTVTIRIPGHGNPLGIGGRWPHRISPNSFAKTLHTRLFKNIPYNTALSLSIDFLSCNACTPLCGTEFLTELTNPEMQELITRTSFAGRFLRQFTMKYFENNNGSSLNIEVSGIIGYYHPITDRPAYAAPSANMGQIRLKTFATDATVRLSYSNSRSPAPTSQLTRKEVQVTLPKTILTVPPAWLLSEDIPRELIDDLKPDGDQLSHAIVKKLPSMSHQKWGFFVPNPKQEPEAIKAFWTSVKKKTI